MEGKLVPIDATNKESVRAVEAANIIIDAVIANPEKYIAMMPEAEKMIRAIVGEKCEN